MSATKLPEIKVAEEVALTELKSFIEYHLEKEITEDDLRNGYEQSLLAVQIGNLDLSDADAPVLKLRQPINNENGGTEVDEVKFLTRITRGKLADLAKGIDLNKNSLQFANKMTSYLCQFASPAFLDKVKSKSDSKVIDQITGLFI